MEISKVFVNNFPSSQVITKDEMLAFLKYASDKELKQLADLLLLCQPLKLTREILIGEYDIEIENVQVDGIWKE